MMPNGSPPAPPPRGAGTPGSRGRLVRIVLAAGSAVVLAAAVAAGVPGAGLSPAAAAPAPPGWSPVFVDDFNGTGGAGDNWQYDLGQSYPGGPANFGTGEVETVTSSTANVFRDGAGHLAIRPIRDSAGNWTSGRIETRRTDFQAPAGGKLRVEASIQMPNVTGAAARGYWPAFWMLGAPFRGNYWNWPAVGEMDIMENVQGLNNEWATLHCGTSPGGPCNETSGIGGQRACAPTTCQGGFHTYTLEWDRSSTPEVLRWYLDGVNFHTVRSDQVDPGTWAAATGHGFFLILNVAMGGGFPGAFGGGPDGATESGHPMLVDYVAVWRSDGGTSPPPTDPPPTDPPPAGSATLYPQHGGALGGPGGSASADTIPPADGANHDGTPYHPLVYTASGLTLRASGGAPSFDLFVDAGSTVADGQQLRISYDLTGDGSWDRVETYRYFATDPVPGWEHYTQAAGLLSATGTLGDLRNGRVRIEVWSAIGNGPSSLGVGNQSVVHLPFS